jgi:pheromone a factor receptor
MAWTAVACLNQFINSIVWDKNAINYAPVWCDICKIMANIYWNYNLMGHKASRIIIGTAVAIPAASLCINRRLYRIASVRRVMITKAEKRRQVMVDLAIGLGLPFLEMILRKPLSENIIGLFI